MKKRFISRAWLKGDCVEKYREFHRNVPKELTSLYARAGITGISCFMSGNELIVVSEYDDSKYPASRAMINSDPAEIEWSRLMRPLCDENLPASDFEEVYHYEDNSI